MIFFLSGYRARGIWEWPSEDQIEPKERNGREFGMKWNFSSIKHNFPDFFSLFLNLYSLHFFLVPFTSTGGIKSCGKKFDFNWDFFTYSEETFCTFVTTQHTELSFFLVDRMDGRSFIIFPNFELNVVSTKYSTQGKNYRNETFSRLRVAADWKACYFRFVSLLSRTNSDSNPVSITAEWALGSQKSWYNWVWAAVKHTKLFFDFPQLFLLLLCHKTQKQFSFSAFLCNLMWRRYDFELGIRLDYCERAENEWKILLFNT